MNIIKNYSLVVIGVLIGMGLFYWLEELCK